MQQQKSPREQDRTRLNVQSAFQVYPCVTFANIPLAKASQMAQLRVNAAHGHTEWIQRCESLKVITITMYHTSCWLFLALY